MVMTSNGLKQIKDIASNDFVLTHANTFEKVLAARKTGTKNIFRIKGMGIDEIKCTENHKFYVREMTRHYPRKENGKRGSERIFSLPKWIECKDLTKKHYLGVAINQNSIIPTWDGIVFEWTDGRKSRYKNELSKLMDNHSFWWMIGRYLGDGWIRSSGGIIICCSKGETMEILPHLRNCNFNYSISEERTVNKIHIPLKELQKFVEQFGYGAENKHIPGFVFDMPEKLLQSLVDGYVGADGSAKNNLYKATSISRELIYGMAQLVAKAYKTPYRIYKDIRKPTCIIEGRVCSQKNTYQLVFKTKKKKQDKAFYEDGYIWFPVQSVENTNLLEDIYDIEVEDKHSFTVNGVIAHNCQDLSLAGKQRGMTKGSGTRSGLLWEVERLLNETENLPQVLLMENVPQVHGSKNIDDFNLWIDFLKSKGYSNFWQDLNAKDYGVAQNRKRCFMVSILGNETYRFPKPVKLIKRMKDYLEDEVDEKYYLKSEKADSLIADLEARGILDGKEKVTCDGTTNKPREIDVMNTVCARYDNGISSRQSEGGGGSRTCLMNRNRIEKIDNEVSNTLMARDYKGFGNQSMNGVIEIE